MIEEQPRSLTPLTDKIIEGKHQPTLDDYLELAAHAKAKELTNIAYDY